MKFPITRKYLPNKSRRRPGLKNLGVFFIVDHDSGNPGSSARGNVGWMDSTANSVPLLQVSSAHTFIDDIEIIECVPLDEIAYHVLFGTKVDNTLYGHDANRAAAGVELCYGGKINNIKAYEKYVWYNAYLCYTYYLNPRKHITAHYILDPGRKIDPKKGLAAVGKDLQSFIQDVEKELQACTQDVKGVSKPIEKEEEEITVTKILKFSTNEGKNAILRVLKRFEQKNPALAKTWREKVESGTFTEADSHEVLWVAIDRGYITGKTE